MQSRNFINFTAKGDERGWLIALESLKEVPFVIHRVYYIYSTQNGVVRGKHAHRDLRQLAVCVHGSCRILMDNGSERWAVELDRKDKGILIEPMVWHEMDSFSHDCVLMVMASALYDERDYIRNYADFLLLSHR